MKVYSATFLASSISGLSLITCLFMIANIYTDVQNIWAELDQEIGSFKATTDDLWIDMMRLGATKKRFRREDHATERVPVAESSKPSYENSGGPVGRPVPRGGRAAGPGSLGPSSAPGTPAGASPPSVPPALSGTDKLSGLGGCSCQIDNKCPVGPIGLKGIAGKPGPEGKLGLDGVPGVDAMDVTPKSKDIAGCFNCPAGPQGSPGPIGRPGPRGHPGAKGQPGMPGRDGNPGSSGEQGPPGPPGALGNMGPVGEKGRDAEHPIGRPGARGPRGIQGPLGPQGNSGKSAPQGEAGPKGLLGGPGPKGPTGLPGPIGAEGPIGRPGKDAEYCPCPTRNSDAGGSRSDAHGAGASGNPYRRY